MIFPLNRSSENRFRRRFKINLSHIWHITKFNRVFTSGNRNRIQRFKNVLFKTSHTPFDFFFFQVGQEISIDVGGGNLTYVPIGGKNSKFLSFHSSFIDTV